MDIKPIRTEQDYQDALTAISGLMCAEFGTPEGDRLDVLATLVEAWERQHYPMDAPDPIEAIKFAMEQHGYEVKDLVPMIFCCGKDLADELGICIVDMGLVGARDLGGLVRL